MLSVALSAAGAFGWQAPNPAGQEQRLKIVILDGDGGENILKKKTAVKPVVEVRDKNDLPVAGALVTFLLPNVGPGGTFANGSKVVTVLTNAKGQAAMGAWSPAGTGSFNINVTASFQGQTASASIGQTNVAGGISSAALGGIIGAAAAAAVVAAKVLSGGGEDKPQAPQTPSATIGAGAGPVFTPPR